MAFNFAAKLTPITKKPVAPKKPKLDEKIIAKINQRRRQMLVHSRLYYKLDTSIVDDHQWSKWARELAQLQRDYPNESKKGVYYRDFYDWGGASGFNLPMDDPWVVSATERVLTYHLEHGMEGLK